MAQSFKHLKQIAPGRAAAGDKPEVGPTYRTAYAADGLDHVPATCYDLFKCVCIGFLSHALLTASNAVVGAAHTHNSEHAVQGQRHQAVRLKLGISSQMLAWISTARDPQVVAHEAATAPDTVISLSSTHSSCIRSPLQLLVGGHGAPHSCSIQQPLCCLPSWCCCPCCLCCCCPCYGCCCCCCPAGTQLRSLRTGPAWVGAPSRTQRTRSWAPTLS